MFDFSNQARGAIGVVLLDGFSMLTLGSILEPLTLLHRKEGDCGSGTLLFGENGTQAVSNGGFVVSCKAGIESLEEYSSRSASLEILFVCGPSDRVVSFAPGFVSDLRRAHRKGVRIVGLGNVGWPLADMGLLDNAKATVHWNTLAAFSEENIFVDAEDQLFASTGSVATSGGETAALDFVLEMMSKECPEIAREIADQLLVSVRRDGGTPQPSSELTRMRNHPAALSSAMLIMLRTQEEPIPKHELARRCGISTRQLERLFRAHLNMSPMQYYTRIRLEKAHQLVTFTALPLNEIALAAGFSNTALMGKKFRKWYGQSPSELRLKLDYVH